MKQPILDELRVAVNQAMDPLDIVNAFIKTPTIDTPLLPHYWEHRICAMAEMIVATRNKGRR